jgi:hypothetical protein
MKKYNIKYPKSDFKLDENKIIHIESGSLVSDYTEILTLQLSIYENDCDIIIEGIINVDNYEIMITPLLSLELINE